MARSIKLDDYIDVSGIVRNQKTLDTLLQSSQQFDGVDAIDFVKNVAKYFVSNNFPFYFGNVNWYSRDTYTCFYCGYAGAKSGIITNGGVMYTFRYISETNIPVFAHNPS